MLKVLLSAFWRKFGADIRYFAAVLAAIVAFQTTAYGMYHIPSESMLPTLAVGDRVVVNKFAYGYSRHSLPFSIGPDWTSDDGRIFSRLPERGDVVVFAHPRTNVVMIKRAVGLPGDVIEVANGRLIVNGAKIDDAFREKRRYKEHKGGVAQVERRTESFPDGKRYDVYDRGPGLPADDFGPVRVAPGTLFVMGDNRDNSLDSRFGGDGVGLLPVDQLIGRAELMAFSFNLCLPSRGLECLNRQWAAPL